MIHKLNVWTVYIQNIPELNKDSKEIHDIYPLLKKHCQNYPPESKFIELGCSNGRFGRWFEKEFGFETYGIDNNPIAIGQVKNGSVQDAKALNFKENTFDIVFSRGLIEHFKDPMTILKEAKRILKPGGLMITTIPQMPSLWYFFLKIQWDLLSGYQHYFITNKRLIRMHQELGLKVIDRFRLGRFKQWLPKCGFTSTEVILFSIKN